MARGHLGSVVAFLRRATGSAETGERTDGALLERFIRHNDEAAFAELVGRHGPMVLAVCLRILGDAHAAEDAFQATFLVLARKAGSVRRPDGVGCWLHSIAVRVARKMRAGGLRRRECTALVEAADGSDPVAEAALKELGTLLDEELGRLPETYRAPLILCYLEGRTNDEAARELGWPRGTVSGRLARARDLLRGRLVRRGLALSAVALASLLAGSAARAGVPPALAGATVQAAAGFAAGAIAATPAVILAQGVLETMFVVKLKFAACLLLAVGTLGAGAGFVTQKALAAPAADPAPQDDAAEAARLRRQIEDLRKKLEATQAELAAQRDLAEQARREAETQRDRAERERARALAAQRAAERALQQALEEARRAEAEARKNAEEARKVAEDAQRKIQADDPVTARNRKQSMDNLKQIGLAFHNYHDQHGTLPAAAISDKQDKPLLSWRVALLPYLEQNQLYQQFKLDEPWDSEHNLKLLDKMPKVFAAPGKDSDRMTYYRVFLGKGAMFEGTRGMRMTAVVDGLSNTLMAVEAGAPVAWTKPDDLPFDPQKATPRLGGLFGGGFNMLLGDGSVRFVKPGYDEKLLRIAIQRDDGQVFDFKDLHKD